MTLQTLQAKIIATAIILFATLSIGFGSGWGVRAFVAEKQQLKSENSALSKALDASIDYQKKVEERDVRNLELRKQLTDLDRNLTNARNKALAENADLRADLAVAQRMHLRGSSCPDRPAGDQAGTAPGVDHGAQVELSDQTRLAVFDLRESIIGDVAALEACQAYVRKLGLYP